MTDLESEGQLGVELSSVQWKPVYFDTIEEAEKYMATHETYPQMFDKLLTTNKVIVFIKE